MSYLRILGCCAVLICFCFTRTPHTPSQLLHAGTPTLSSLCSPLLFSIAKKYMAKFMMRTRNSKNGVNAGNNAGSACWRAFFNCKQTTELFVVLISIVADCYHLCCWTWNSRLESTRISDWGLIEFAIPQGIGGRSCGLNLSAMAPSGSSFGESIQVSMSPILKKLLVLLQYIN